MTFHLSVFYFLVMFVLILLSLLYPILLLHPVPTYQSVLPPIFSLKNDKRISNTDTGGHAIKKLLLKLKHDVSKEQRRFLLARKDCFS